MDIPFIHYIIDGSDASNSIIFTSLFHMYFGGKFVDEKKSLKLEIPI